MEIELKADTRDEEACKWIEQVTEVLQKSTAGIDWESVRALMGKELLIHGTVLTQTTLKDGKIEITVDTTRDEEYSG